MVSDRQDEIERMCQAALEHDPGARAAFLAEACAGDEALRQEVESLLAHERSAEGFLTALAMEVVARGMDRASTGPIPGRQIGAYRVVARLGTGGMDI